MYDPWETIEFGFIEAPSWFFPRLPLLLAALLLHSVAWTAIAWMMLSPTRWSWAICACVLTAFFSLTIGEIAVSSGVFLFEKPWPLLPVSMEWAWWLTLDLQLTFVERRHEFSPLDDVAELSIILVTRLTALGGSLLLLRLAGFRLVAGSAKPVNSAAT